MRDQMLLAEAPLCGALLDLLGGDKKLLRELIGMFLEDCPGYMAKVRAALDRQDPAALHAAAHLLRGALGNFGKSQAYEEARALEAMGRSGDLRDAETAHARLEEAIRHTQHALAELAAS